MGLHLAAPSLRLVLPTKQQEDIMEWIEVVPAYGRDYKNQASVKADWNADKDFRDRASGRYVY
jgi:hypothetical protein